MHDITHNIETLVETLDISYMEACLKYCEDNGIEIELVGDVIRRSTDLKQKLEVEAIHLNFLKHDDD